MRGSLGSLYDWSLSLVARKLYICMIKITQSMSSKDFVFVIIGLEARTKQAHSASIVNVYYLFNWFAMKEDHNSLL
jgi:hypothetical protein